MNQAPAISADTGGVRWQLRTEYRDLLLGPDGLRLDEWLRTGQARAVKQGPHRVVYHLLLPGLNAYLKHYRLHDTRAWLRECVRPSKARMEWDRALEVAARGIPTIEPLALGECRGRWCPGDSFLLTRTLEQTEPLHTFLEQTLPGFEPLRATLLRQRLAVALGDLAARLHDSGIRHNDLHAGNLLVRLEADDRPALFLIDLHAVGLGQPLGWRSSRANLVMLNRWFVLRADRSDRLRFWQSYCKTRGLSTRYSTQARDLEQLTWQSNLSFWKQRDRRCLVTNRYYRRLRTAHVVGHAVADLERAVLTPLLADPDEPFRRPGIVLLKDSRSSTVAEFDLQIDGQPRRVIYKRFRLVGPGDPWAALVRRTPALRSWVFGQGLRERLLPTPRPLAVLHRRRHGLLYEGYLLTEKVEAAQDLRAFVDNLARLTLPQRRACLRYAVDQVAQLVRELHGRQLGHRDLKAANILVSKNAEGDGYRSPQPGIRSPYTAARGSRALPVPFSFWLIDLVGVTRHRQLSFSRRVQNLARLHASFHDHAALTRTDRLRFLRLYLQWGLFGRETWKDWWREVEQATRVKVARNARRGRPLA